MKKIFILFSFVVTCLFAMVPTSLANSPFVISEEKAGGYQYKVIKDQDLYTWEIGHKDHLITIKKDSSNSEELEEFRRAVIDIHLKTIQLIIAATYLLIIIISLVFVYIKKKPIVTGSSLAIILVLAMLAAFYTITTSMGLYTSFQDAHYYYLTLISSM